MDELTREFLIESQEGLDRMERCLTDLEERPQDAGLIGDIFRSVHTIKGTTGFLGFKRLEKLAHAGENLLGLVREGKLIAGREIITGLLQLLDGLRSILKTIEAEEAEGEGEDTVLIGRLEELQLPAQAEVKHLAHAKAGAHARPLPCPPCAPGRGQIQRRLRLPFRSDPDLLLRASLLPARCLNRLPRWLPKANAETENDAARQRAPIIGSAAESTLRVDVTLAEPDDEPGGRAGADPQSGFAGHFGRSQYDPAQPPPGYGDG